MIGHNIRRIKRKKIRVRQLRRTQNNTAEAAPLPAPIKKQEQFNNAELG